MEHFFWRSDPKETNDSPTLDATNPALKSAIRSNLCPQPLSNHIPLCEYSAGTPNTAAVPQQTTISLVNHKVNKSANLPYNDNLESDPRSLHSVKTAFSDCNNTILDAMVVPFGSIGRIKFRA